MRTWFNPRPRIEPLALDDGRTCHVVDDVLLEPERVRQWAVARSDAFHAVDFNAYPGTYLMPPAALEQALHAFFLTHIRPLFGARRLLRMHCRFGMVTLAPGALKPYQWLCHSDQVNPDPGHSIQASVLYLFADPALGGTSFYTPTHNARETAVLFDDTVSLPAAEFTRRYGIAPGYMLGSNAYFSCIGSVPARWNRMIFYDGSMLHSGDIRHPERLTSDPLDGRLTLNGFYTCRRHAR